MEEPQDPGEDATSAEPVSGEPSAPSAASGPSAQPGVEPFAVPKPETVASPDAEAAIDDFEIPPPPTFDAPPPAAAPAPVVSPASAAEPASDGAAPALRKRSTWTPDDTWTSASAHKQEVVPPTAAEKAEMRARESRAATARDEATRNYVSPAAGGTDENSYRGWTFAIFAGLAVLLIGAIVLIALLVNNAPLPFASGSEAVAWAEYFAPPR